jgi:hypothetical protein
MKRGRVAIITLIFFLISSSSQAVHIKGDEGAKPGPASTDEMTNRIVELAVELESHAPIRRIALYDVAFPSNPEEYKRLGGMGILLISSVNQDRDEHPITDVIVETPDKKYNLPFIAKRNVIVENEKVKKLFGPNRVDYYYLIPYPLILQEGQITIDWSKNRKDFVVAKLPFQFRLHFIKDTRDIGLPAQVDRQTLENFLLREFSFEGDLSDNIFEP